MSHPVSPQHPAVVLRSHYVHLRALLAIAMIAVVGLTVAVVILATSQSGGTSASSAAPASATAGSGATPYRGPEEGSGAGLVAPRRPSARHEGGGGQRLGGRRP